MFRKLISVFAALLIMMSVTACANTKPTTTTQPALATKADADQIAAQVIRRINEYRATEGVCTAEQMEDCAAYTQYRSAQMAEKGRSDSNIQDMRQASTDLQYGTFFDPSRYGASGEPYYTVRGFEAACTAEAGTSDEVAKALAGNFFDTKYEWACLGSDAYRYISVGVTEKDGKWYCCALVSQNNLDEA